MNKFAWDLGILVAEGLIKAAQNIDLPPKGFTPEPRYVPPLPKGFTPEPKYTPQPVRPSPVRPGPVGQTSVVPLPEPEIPGTAKPAPSGSYGAYKPPIAGPRPYQRAPGLLIDPGHAPIKLYPPGNNTQFKPGTNVSAQQQAIAQPAKAQPTLSLDLMQKMFTENPKLGHPPNTQQEGISRMQQIYDGRGTIPRNREDILRDREYLRQLQRQYSQENIQNISGQYKPAPETAPGTAK